MLGEHIAQYHRDHGVDIICGAAVASLDGSGRVEAVSLADGRRLEADLVLAAIGAAPAVDWLRSSGLDVSNGVMCDSTCAVLGTDGIVAAGDMANWFNPLYSQNMRIEHWTNAIQQGTYAARSLLGTAAPEGFVSAPYFWSDQFDMKVQSIGVGVGYDEIRVLEHSEHELLIAYGRSGQLAGVAGVGSGTAINRYRRLVEERAPMDTVEAPATAGKS
jgi:NADPH-dependent 2,4-dienoyl-CoA reductase/sulfur reductase-like enzyme